MEGYELAYNGPCCAVWVAKRARKVGSKAPADQRARMDRLMKHLANNGPEAFNPTQYKHEGRFPSGRPGGGVVAVFALKAYQLRFYGGFVNLGGKRCFVVEDGDIKKKDKADQSLLVAVAKKLGSEK